MSAKVMEKTNMLYSEQIVALNNACFGDIFSFLGPHRIDKNHVDIRLYLPGAKAVSVVLFEQQLAGERCADSDLFIVRLVVADAVEAYQLEVTYSEGKTLIEDPYRFASQLDQEAIYLFNEGNLQQAYRHLGAQFIDVQGISGVRFAVWAPNTHSVSVIGDFNHWNPACHIMRKHPASGVWDLFIPALVEGQCYKFHIVATSGETLEKSDPYAASMQHPPATASRLLARQAPHPDQRWAKKRHGINRVDGPVSIYEVHAGSWRRVIEEGNRYLSYREMAAQLVPYVKDMGFTHVQFMPLSEFPFDGSWGYQPVGMFAPTSRFGSAEDFAFMVQQFHDAGIAVLLDWVPGHFPSDAHGLARYDGTHLYEHADSRMGFHPDWNTHIYNYGRNEVRSFIMSSALYWLDEFEIDGLRVDAVASMLYLDYSRDEGQWLPNHYGGRENLDAISLLQTVNARSYQAHPGVSMVAEESTAWPGVTNFVDQGGLGFGYKWNMGWMNDSLSYMQRDPLYRQHHHENYILPISHDEVVHGKGSMINKMPGDHWQKFANLRAYYGFMWAHPGKKLLFMGCEFAQWQEWNHDHSLDWHLLDDACHLGIQRLVKDLNQLYKTEPALHQLDCNHQGFRWIDGGNASQSVFSFIRYDQSKLEHETKHQSVVVVVNMTPTVYRGFRLGVEQAGSYRQIFNTDLSHYGGTDIGVVGPVVSDAVPSHGLPHRIEFDVAPLAMMMFKRE